MVEDNQELQLEQEGKRTLSREELQEDQMRVVEGLETRSLLAGLQDQVGQDMAQMEERTLLEEVQNRLGVDLQGQMEILKEVEGIRLELEKQETHLGRGKHILQLVVEDILQENPQMELGLKAQLVSWQELLELE